MLPGILALIFGEESQIYSVVYSRLDEATVAIIAVELLFLLPVTTGPSGASPSTGTRPPG